MDSADVDDDDANIAADDGANNNTATTLPHSLYSYPSHNYKEITQ